MGSLFGNILATKGQRIFDPLVVGGLAASSCAWFGGVGIVGSMEQLLAPLAIFLPIIVLFIGYRLRSVDTRIATLGVRAEHMLAVMQQQTEALKGIQQEVERGNALMRQLLRAYGHEPDERMNGFVARR